MNMEIFRSVHRGRGRWCRALVALMLAASARANITAAKAPGDGDGALGQAVAILESALVKADRFEVFEGLPHPFEGKKFVENERLTKLTFELDEQWFYAKAQPMPVADVAALQRLLSEGALKPWRGMKLCGGFHADYAVRIVAAGEVHHVLFCFSCGEARILGAPEQKAEAVAAVSSRITADLAPSQVKELRALFSKYRDQRPPTPSPKKAPVVPVPPPTVPVRF
jgi:hypothetical protein